MRDFVFLFLFLITLILGFVFDSPDLLLAALLCLVSLKMYSLEDEINKIKRNMK